jgi:hypothetical protein
VSNTAGDLINDPLFSYLRIEEGEEITIPANQQMLVSGHIYVGGHLSVSGTMLDILARQPEQHGYAEVAEPNTVVVWLGRQLIYHSVFPVRGHLRVVGELVPA